MRVKNTKVKITIPIPVDKPDVNGRVFTKEAVDNAVCNLRTNIPILYGDDETGKKVIGTTTGTSHIVAWDSENQVCKMTVDGVVFHGGAETIIKEIKDGKISSFEIVSVGLTK